MADAKRQYTAIFAIGGKLLGSFKSVTLLAEARMRRLRTVAVSFGGALTKLTGVVGLLGAGLGAFGIVKVFKSIFEGATEEAANFLKMQKSIQFLLLKNNTIMAAGHGDMQKSLAFAKQQEQLITAHNEALAEQSVLSEKIYEAMSKQLALMGIPTKQIMHSVSAMGDLLVAVEGVTASEDEAVQLAKTLGKAIMTGKLPARQGARYGLFLPTDWGKQIVTYQGRLDDLMKRIKFAKGLAVSETLTPLGRIQRYNNELEKMRREIGNELIPLHARMADMWVKVLPKVKPLLLDAVDLVGKATEGIADVIEQRVIPAWENFKNVVKGTQMPQPADVGRRHFLEPQVPAQYQFSTQLAELYKALKRLKGKFKDPAEIWANYSDWWDTQITNIINEWERLKEQWSKIDWTFGFAKQWEDALKQFHGYWDDIKKQWTNRPTWMGGTGGAAAGAAAASPAAVAAAAAPTAAAQKAATQIPLSSEGLGMVQAERAHITSELQRPELRNLVSATLATEATGAEDQKNVLEALVNRGVAEQQAGTYKGVESMIKGGFYGPWKRGETSAVMSKGLSDARSLQVKEMIDQVSAGRNALGGLTDQGMINEIHGAIKEQHGEDYYGLRKPSEASTAAYKYSRAYQQGGIANTPQIATLAEKGPEAVIPLTRGSRAAQLLTGGGGHTLNFTPNITINGNATEAEQRAMDSRLRDLASDFIKQFSRAQNQERRLSYEGGYA
jgi:hypothetical protein